MMDPLWSETFWSNFKYFKIFYNNSNCIYELYIRASVWIINCFNFIYIYIYIYYILARSITLTEGLRLRVFKNRRLKVIFGHNKKVILEGGWKICNSMRFLFCYSTPFIVSVTKSRVRKKITHGGLKTMNNWTNW